MWQEATFGVRVLQALGIKNFIVTNAAGGMNPNFSAGDLMLITDHINLTGTNPLIGPNDPALGTRFPDMLFAYDPVLGELAKKVATSTNIPMREGVYVGLAGPTYETPAEVRMLRTMGADAVGMSTVSEVIVARHAGIRVLGISTISNLAIDTLQAGLKVEHEEVMAVGKLIAPRLEQIIRGVLREIDQV
jgi:purine-nucleoside phosphorylase